MIRKHDYQFISTSLGQAQFVGKSMYDSVGDMIRHLRNNEIVQSNAQKQGMLQVMFNTYNMILTNHVYVTSQMADVVRALQEHVIKHFGSVDAYLSEHELKVSGYFAHLSSVIGYPISSENIE